MPPKLRIAVPRPDDLDVAGDAAAAASFAASVERAKALGAEIVPLDMAPFNETARLLYDGPWVAERLAARGDRLVLVARRRGLQVQVRGDLRLEELLALTGLSWQARQMPSMTVWNGTPRAVWVCGSKKISAWTTPSAAARSK